MIRDFLIAVGILFELYVVYFLLTNLNVEVCSPTGFCLWAVNLTICVIVGFFFICIGFWEDLE